MKEVSPEPMRVQPALGRVNIDVCKPEYHHVIIQQVANRNGRLLKVTGKKLNGITLESWTEFSFKFRNGHGESAKMKIKVVSHTVAT